MQDSIHSKIMSSLHISKKIDNRFTSKILDSLFLRK